MFEMVINILFNHLFRNKFLTIAVPVAPGQQDIYKAPVGTSAIVLYAQVSNVGVNTTPSVTFTHRRTSVATRTLGNVRNNRIIKDGEIPPNECSRFDRW